MTTVTTMGLLLWSALVLGIISAGFYMIFKSIKYQINKDYKYCINFNKDGITKGNYPLIKMKIRGKYKHFLLDSGANVNIISKSALSSIMNPDDTFEITGNGSVVGIGGKQVTIPVIKETISIGRDKFTEEFRVLDNWEAARKAIKDTTGVEIIGLLGSEFFIKAKWLLDFEELTVLVKK